MARFKKTRSTARFGPRYGRKARKVVADIEAAMRPRSACPKCSALSVRRVGTALFRCRRCGVVFAGGAYLPASVRAPPAEEAAAE
ncbi:MAG: 50S ribosomal protein L37ae [Halobacteria archaeon]|jgi:large subunit ribosomal protein L37Ae